MTETDFLTVMGYFFAAFAAGYCSGVLMRAARRVMESVTGMGG